MPGRAGEGEGEEGFALNELQSGSSEQSKKKRTRGSSSVEIMKRGLILLAAVKMRKLVSYAYCALYSFI